MKKIALWTLSILLAMILAVDVVIRLPGVQNYARKKSVAYLEKTLGTPVRVDRLRITFPRKIVLEGVCFIDQQGDTLFAGEKLQANIHLYKLLWKTLEVGRIECSGVTAKIRQALDSTYNFDYLLDAFSGENTKPEGAHSKPMAISLGRILFDRVVVQYQSVPDATDASIAVGRLNLDAGDIDFDTRTYHITALEVDNTTGSFVRRKLLTSRDATDRDFAARDALPGIDLQIARVALSAVQLHYTDENSDVRADMDFGKINITSDNLNLDQRSIALKNISLENSSIALAMGQVNTAHQEEEEANKDIAPASEAWKVTVGTLHLEKNTIVYDDFNAPPVAEGVDYAHLHLRDLALQAEDLLYSDTSMAVRVSSASCTEESSLSIKQFRGTFQLSEKTAFAKALHVETEASLVDADVELQFPSRDSIAVHPESLYQKSVFRKSTLRLSDLYLLAPELEETEPFRNITSDAISVDAETEGYLNDLKFKHVNFSGLTATKLRMSGSLKGLPDANRISFDLRIDDLNTNSSDIAAVLPPGTISDSMRIPGRIQAKGTLRGNVREFEADMDLTTSSGNASIDGTIHLDEPMSVQGELALDDFQAGEVFMLDSLLGGVTLHVKGDLKEIGTDSMSGAFMGNIDRIRLLQYAYQNIAFDVNANRGTMKGTFAVNDPSLEVTLNANTVFVDSTFGQTDIWIDLERADLTALHLADGPLVLHGRASGDFANFDKDSLNGTLAFANLAFEDSTHTVQIDTLFVMASAEANNNTLEIQSDFLTLEMHGDYQLISLFPALNRSIAGYLTAATDSVASITAPQQLVLTGELRYSPLFTQIDSNIGRFAPIALNGNFDSGSNKLSFSGETEHMVYQPAVIDHLNFRIDSKGNALHYVVDWDDLRSDAVDLHKSALEGDLRSGDIASSLTIHDHTGREQFHLNVNISQQGSGYVLSLRPEDLLLNYERWDITADNEIRYDTNSVAVHNVVLSNGRQRLSVRSDPPGVNQPIAIEFDSFRIETIAQIFNSDSVFAGGTIDGKAVVRNYFSSPVFTSDVNIKDLSYHGDTIGDLQMKVDNETANTLSAQVSVSDDGNTLDLEGRYMISSETLDLTAHIARLKLAAIEGFGMGAFSDAHGSMHGDLKVSGKILKPVVAGDLHFDSASVYVTQLNARYALANEGVRFTNSDIHFHDFTVTDEEDNLLHFNGVIYTETFSNFTFALDINSDNFKVLNTQAHQNDLYYGTLYLDSRIHVRGGLNKPEINADLKILDKTRMTIILPQTDPGIVEREGVVTFVDLDHPGRDSVIAISLDALNTTTLQGLVAFVNIKVTDASEFTLVIDQGSGDFLRLRGNAELSASLDPSGKISLSGNYLLKEGVYELSFNFIKRRFDIRSGSTITWNGEPTSGEIHVTAAYTVEAAPIDLVEQQIAGASQTEANYYKEKLPFELLLKLTGTLIQPEVAFSIELPEGNYQVSPEVVSAVQAKLQQLRREESEVNKQAFALVLLNRFISDDPFHSAAGGTSAESYARQSVSKLLSQQLNNLTSDLVAGVDLNFDLESTEDYSTGELQNRTDLNVSASKRLLNDRITVTVGSNFELEGSVQPSERTSNIAGDISLEYQLSKNGRYLLRAYRKEEYEVAVEGYIIETGLSFVIQLDWDKFKEIMSSSKHKGEDN